MKLDEVTEWVQSLGDTDSKRREVIQSILTHAGEDDMLPEDLEEAKIGLEFLDLLDRRSEGGICG